MMACQNKNENIISEPEIGYIPHPGGLGCTLYEKMWENQDKIAQIDAVTGEQQTYRSLLQDSVRTAIRLRSKGLKPKDMITICGVPRVEISASYIASLFLRIIPSTLDPSLSVDEMAHLLVQVQPKIVFVGEEALHTITDALNKASVKAEIVVFETTFSEYLKEDPEEGDFKPSPVEDLKETASILFSSGTSGLPKGICLTHLGILQQIYSTGQCLPITRALTYGSFYWISTVHIMLSSAISGSSRIIVPKFDLSQFWYIMSTYQPTMLFLTPSLVTAVLAIGRPENVNRLHLKLAVISGGPVSERHMRALSKVLPEATVMLAYAQTELTGVISCFRLDKPEDMALLEKKPNCSGKLMPGYSAKVVNPETEEVLGPNQRGELRIKSRSVMSGYYNMDSTDAFDADGWLKTGDIGYYDEDFCMYIVDRLKDVIKYRGYQIVPAVVEAILLQHPAVTKAVVLGIPNEEDGEHPMALVVLSQDYKAVLPKEIEEFVEEKVSNAQKLRGGVRVVDKIPLTLTGKVKKRELKQMVIHGEL